MLRSVDPNQRTRRSSLFRVYNARRLCLAFVTHTTPPLYSQPNESKAPHEILCESESHHRSEHTRWQFVRTDDLLHSVVQEYHHATDIYTIKYKDDNFEVMAYSAIRRIVPGTSEYADQQCNLVALTLAYHAAIDEASAAVSAMYDEPTSHNTHGRLQDG